MDNKLLPFQGWRLTFFQAIMVAVFLIFTIRMYEFMVVRHGEFQLAADENRINELPLAAPRGIIVDRYNTPLATNSPAFTVSIVPAALPDDPDEVLQIYNRLSALIGVPPTREVALTSGRNIRSIEEMVREGEGIAPFRPVIIATDIPFEVALQINEEKVSMPGVSVNAVSVREYPTGTLTSHIIGYMVPIPAEEAEELIEQGYDPAFDRVGWEGIERFLENILGGQRGVRRREVDVAGEEIRVLEQIPPTQGLNVRLTLDTELQAAAEQALKDRIALVNSQAGRIVTQQGVVIAMNPQTGEVLAMVSWPAYDNSRFARAIDVEYYLDVLEDPLRPLVNNAIKSLYPPGSVWKLITAVGVLEEDVIEPETRLFDGGELLLPNSYAPNDRAQDQRFVCWLAEGHGSVNMVEGIAWSCDVYFYQVGGGNPGRVSPQVLRENGLGIRDLFRYATAFGIGSELGIELPFENAGRMPDPDWKRRVYGESWSTGDTYNAAFGQGYVLVTPLQLINAVAAIANNGILYQPTIIREIYDEEGNVVEPFEPKILRTINLDEVPEGDVVVLTLLEDMIIHGPNSLACTCEEDSEWYNPSRCDPENYRSQVDIDPDPFTTDMREYRVHIPLNYTFNGGVCEPLRFSTELNPYTPAFASTETLQIVREGMRAAVTIDGGTARAANLSFVTVAGKTGTAEYCDDIARPLGLCVPGNWPAHAWFVAYAPYDTDPEIIVIAFVYNGDEGSQVALPIVVQTMEAYFRLKNERENLAREDAAAAS